jgi:hypothetical protein
MLHASEQLPKLTEMPDPISREEMAWRILGDTDAIQTSEESPWPTGLEEYNLFHESIGPTAVLAVEGLARQLPRRASFAPIVFGQDARVESHSPLNAQERAFVAEFTGEGGRAPDAYSLWSARTALGYTRPSRTFLVLDLQTEDMPTVTAVVRPHEESWQASKINIRWGQWSIRPEASRADIRYTSDKFVTFPSRAHRKGIAPPNDTIFGLESQASPIYVTGHNDYGSNNIDADGKLRSTTKLDMLTNNQEAVVSEFGMYGLACYAIWEGVQALMEAGQQELDNNKH